MSNVNGMDVLVLAAIIGLVFLMTYAKHRWRLEELQRQYRSEPQENWRWPSRID